MPETLDVLTTPANLEWQIAVTQQVFALMAGIDIHPLATPLPETDMSLESVIDYLSICKGSIVLQCGAPVAFAFTEQFMDVPMPAAFDDDVRDSLGELVNMIAGNLKGLLSVDTVLSAPVVYHDSLAPLPKTRKKLSCIDFDCEYGPFRLSLYDDR